MPSLTEILEARRRAGLTQSAAADLLGVDRVTWARYEGGTRGLTPQMWAYWLHVSGLKRIPFKQIKSPHSSGRKDSPNAGEMRGLGASR